MANETFISATSTFAETLQDSWTMVGNNGGFMAHHEHTIVCNYEWRTDYIKGDE